MSGPIGFESDLRNFAVISPAGGDTLGTLQGNDQMLDVLSIGVIVFPGTGIQENLAAKARKLGIPVWKFGNGGA